MSRCGGARGAAMSNLEALRAKAEVLCTKVETLSASCAEVGREVRAKEAVIDMLQAQLNASEAAAARHEARTADVERQLADAVLVAGGARRRAASADRRCDEACVQLALVVKQAGAQRRRARVARLVTACGAFVAGMCVAAARR